MSNSFYSVYKNSVFELCKTISVKSEATAEAINGYLVAMGYQVSEEPHKWKYYLNLNGQYHESDTMMTVVSLDTLKTIEFTKENLETHKATKLAYAYGSTYYTELEARYPKQRQLIQRILNPVDLETAINAENHKILWFDSSLVESQETNLIPQLQDWIDTQALTWNVEAYAMVDELYTASALGVMFMHMPAAVLNIRLGNCHTKFVHTYHIWEYLGSHNRLNTYRRYLTLDQALFLYRNIRSLEANVGTEETFDTVIQKFLVERGFPVYAYDIRQDVSTLSEDLKPTVDTIRTVLASPVPNHESVDTFEVKDLLQREQSLARDNIIVEDSATYDAVTSMQASEYNRLPTKVLETEVVDQEATYPITKADVLLHQWIKLAYDGRYTPTLTINNPYSKDTIKLSPKDAWIAYLYCWNRTNGVDLVTIPDVYVHHTMRYMQFTVEALMATVDAELVDQSVVEELIRTSPPVGDYVIPKDFNEFCGRVFNWIQEHRIAIAKQEHYLARGMLEDISNAMFYNDVLDFGDITYADWSDRVGVAFHELTREDCGLLMHEILIVATGVDTADTITVAEIQRAMIEIVRKLTTYDLQFLPSLNSSRGKKEDAPMVRVGDMFGKLFHTEYINAARTTVINHRSSLRHSDAVSEYEPLSEIKNATLTYEKLSLDIGLEYKATESIVHSGQQKISDVDFFNPREP